MVHQFIFRLFPRIVLNKETSSYNVDADNVDDDDDDDNVDDDDDDDVDDDDDCCRV